MRERGGAEKAVEEEVTTRVVADEKPNPLDTCQKSWGNGKILTFVLVLMGTHAMVFYFVSRVYSNAQTDSLGRTREGAEAHEPRGSLWGSDNPEDAYRRQETQGKKAASYYYYYSAPSKPKMASGKSYYKHHTYYYDDKHHDGDKHPDDGGRHDPDKHEDDGDRNSNANDGVLSKKERHAANMKAKDAERKAKDERGGRGKGGKGGKKSDVWDDTQHVWAPAPVETDAERESMYNQLKSAIDSPHKCGGGECLEGDDELFAEILKYFSKPPGINMQLTDPDYIDGNRHQAASLLRSVVTADVTSRDFSKVWNWNAPAVESHKGAIRKLGLINGTTVGTLVGRRLVEMGVIRSKFQPSVNPFISDWREENLHPLVERGIWEEIDYAQDLFDERSAAMREEILKLDIENIDKEEMLAEGERKKGAHLGKNNNLGIYHYHDIWSPMPRPNDTFSQNYEAWGRWFMLFIADPETNALAWEYPEDGKLTEVKYELRCNPKLHVACNTMKDIQAYWDGRHRGIRWLEMKYLIIHPGVWVHPHYGAANNNIKIQMALTVPKNVGSLNFHGTDSSKHPASTHWKPGKSFIFDDSFLHDVYNVGPQEPRIVMDVKFTHPDLSNERREGCKHVGHKSNWPIYDENFEKMYDGLAVEEAFQGQGNVRGLLPDLFESGSKHAGGRARRLEDGKGRLRGKGGDGPGHNGAQWPGHGQVPMGGDGQHKGKGKGSPGKGKGKGDGHGSPMGIMGQLGSKLHSMPSGQGKGGGGGKGKGKGGKGGFSSGNADGLRKFLIDTAYKLMRRDGIPEEEWDSRMGLLSMLQ